jgi:protein MAK11
VCLRPIFIFICDLSIQNGSFTGSITHLSFASRSHLLSASEDGSLCLFRTRDWSVLRALRGHKARVNSVAVHPSGKVALSVGKDNMLRMWDMMRGKGCASTKLGKGV